MNVIKSRLSHVTQRSQSEAQVQSASYEPHERTYVINLDTANHVFMDGLNRNRKDRKEERTSIVEFDKQRDIEAANMSQYGRKYPIPVDTHFRQRSHGGSSTVQGVENFNEPLHDRRDAQDRRTISIPQSLYNENSSVNSAAYHTLPQHRSMYISNAAPQTVEARQFTTVESQSTTKEYDAARRQEIERLKMSILNGQYAAPVQAK
ncbi:hypothetical protein PROFUN_06965 [Planoprotostelium fungivorum]|uniref:Uncharacterized protein n=1 Tax=Planoprotostelium fungivorum TaxID=1890364 RepID=A0A2P6NN91_9EUKA|nr:hypothetical protein PROFUN_06965 [Planoprotostelium fungivorum]